VVADREEWVEQRTVVRAPVWLRIGSVTDLKVKPIEVIVVILAVLFLKGALSVGLEGVEYAWTELVIPIAVALFAFTVWVLRNAEKH